MHKAIYIELNSKHILSFYPKNAFLVGKIALLCLHPFLKNMQKKIFSNFKFIFLITCSFLWKILLNRPPIWGVLPTFSLNIAFARGGSHFSACQRQK